MPNWCQNYVEVSHEDSSKIRALADAMERNEFLNHVIPVPEDLKATIAGSYRDEEQQQLLVEQTIRNVDKYGFGNWYDFCTSRWGTKWDVACQGAVDVHPEGTVVTASFNSAYAPPIGIYEKLVEDGYSVRAYYYESGMCFAGIWDNGLDDCYQNWGDSRGARATLPEELDDFFAISESQAEYEDEEEELSNWIREGVENRENI